MRPVFCRFLLVLALVLPGRIARAQVAETAAAAPSGLWFGDVGTPLRLSGQHGAALCRMAWDALRSGQPGERRAPAEGTPRAVFVSWSDGIRTAEVVHGMGVGPVDALRAALARIPGDRFPFDALRWLKVDVVQTVLTIPRRVGDKEIPGLYARESVLPMPSLFGIAFPQSSGLAFLPDELVGRTMLDPLGRLSGATFSSRLAREGRLDDVVRWGRMVGLGVSQRVSFFETQAWLYDGVACVPLYRGHRLYEDLSRDEARAIAVHAAGRLARLIDDEGRIPAPFPEWLGAAEGRVRPFDAALTILALSAAAHVAEEPAPLVAAAERLAAPMIQSLRRADKGGRTLCLVEPGRRHGDAQRVAGCPPEHQCSLGACSVPLGTARGSGAVRCAPRGDWPAICCPSTRMESASSGRENCSRRCRDGLRTEPTGGLRSAPWWHSTRRQTSESSGRLPPRRSGRCCRGPERRQWGNWPRTSGSCGRRISASPTRVSRSASCRRNAMRWAWWPSRTGAPSSRTCSAPSGGLPSATASASQTGLIAIAARLVHDSGRKTAGREMLADCRSSVVAQLQGHVTEAEAMYLADPPLYRGLFRDHVRSFGFDLQSQYVQILSLCELAKAMEHMGLEGLRDETLASSRKIDEDMAAARARAAQFPGFLGAFDGMLERHRIVVPKRSPEERPAARSPVAPIGDWHAPQAGSADRAQGDDARLPVVRPVRPPQ